MLVSAIMPTRSRPALSRVALNCFLRQTYEPKELVIIDDNDDPSFRTSPAIEGVRYLRTAKMDLGLKRNALCDAALGEIVIHFDSDDWSAPERMSDQVDRLLKSGRPLTGYNTLLFWDEVNGAGYSWKVSHPPRVRTMDGVLETVCGASMCYHRSFWRTHPFPDVEVGEDGHLEAAAQRRGGVSSEESRGLLVARVHGKNTSSASRIGHNGWPSVPKIVFPPAFFEAIQ
jgi:O-antigen biosynthesis protein